MPELPEVETIRREAEREIVGKRIKTVTVTGERSTRRHADDKEFITRLEGAKISGVERKGKNLLFKLDTEDIMVVHLGMSGQLLKAGNRDELPKHTHVVIAFTQGGQLRFVDPRTFGEMFVTTPEELTEAVPELAHLGVDPVENGMSWQTFGHLLMRHPMKLKAFLMDQSIIAGLGNIYSDEILWQAGLRYDRLSNSLSSQEMRRLSRALVETLHDAIKFGGSTLSDQQYLNLSGKPGEYQDHHQVYDREKQACRRCRSTITKAKFQGRSTFFCPDCQV
jgi:formamidopyrimidine-DNA glycosylase